MQLAVPEFAFENSRVVLDVEDALAYCFAILPLALIDVARVVVLALTVTVGLARFEEADVDVAVAVGVPSEAMHAVVDPLALVRLPKFGLNCACPMLDVINDLAFVEATPVLVDLLEVGARFDLLSILSKAVGVVKAHHPSLVVKLSCVVFLSIKRHV